MTEIKKTTLTFTDLVETIKQTDLKLSRQASKAINISLTLRNWLIGMYISEYELRGSDRAKYGRNLIEKLAEKLAKLNISGCRFRQLYNYRAFYRAYPHILRTASAKFGDLPSGIVSTKGKLRTVSTKSKADADRLLGSLSYSHFELLLEIEDGQKRSFYEIECVKGGWSVRELKRQISSLYYERGRLSTNRKKLAASAHVGSEKATVELAIKDPYIFEFLGIKPVELMTESNLENALLDKLQGFLIELGHGFCFEARQKRILIGANHCFVDMVFYHRILKCHVLVELKVDEFKHEYIGQLNTYVSWFKKNIMTRGDNPPVGILLCTDRDRTFAEYALAGMNNKLFVSKYQLELPKKEEMQSFIEEQYEEITEHEPRAQLSRKVKSAIKQKKKGGNNDK